MLSSILLSIKLSQLGSLYSLSRSDSWFLGFYRWISLAAFAYRIYKGYDAHSMASIHLDCMKIVCFVSYISLIAVSLQFQTAVAEFGCSAAVSYKWVKQGFKEEGGKAPPPAEPSSVHFSTVERKGADEVAAKAALEVELARQRIKASEACKREHEAFGECLGTKFTIHKSVMDSLGFSARREFEKALSEECRGAVGSCTAVITGDPVCKEIVVADAAPVAGEGDKKADDKKKKK